MDYLLLLVIQNVYSLGLCLISLNVYNFWTYLHIVRKSSGIKDVDWKSNKKQKLLIIFKDQNASETFTQSSTWRVVGASHIVSEDKKSCLYSKHCRATEMREWVTVI